MPERKQRNTKTRIELTGKMAALTAAAVEHISACPPDPCEPEGTTSDREPEFVGHCGGIGWPSGAPGPGESRPPQGTRVSP